MVLIRWEDAVVCVTQLVAALTYEVEQGCQLPFLDLLLKRTENGGLKL